MTRMSMTRVASGLVALAGLVAASMTPATARGQGYGFGSSPGRASYRPPQAWNNGPYYTAPHWDPYAPRPSVDTFYIYSDAPGPPFNNHPRGRATMYYPDRSPLYPYQQGFAPFSGFAGWYQRTYGFTPTERDLASASAAYFRSSPIPANPRYLAPAVAQAIFAPTPTPSPTARSAAPPAANAPSAATTRPKVRRPAEVRPPKPGPNGVVVYRGAPTARP